MLILTVVLKVGLVAGILVGAGLVLARASLCSAQGPASPRLDQIRRGALALAAICAVAGTALLVVRLGGSLDPAIAAIVAQSPSGLAAGLFVFGATLGMLRTGPAVAGAGLIVLASGVAGHASANSFVSGMIVATHVGAASWWTGGLLILLFACRDTDAGFLPDVLERFSRQARLAIFILLAAGGWAVYDLIGFSMSAFSNAYGQILLLKLAFVAVALGIALYNRQRLTPAVRDGLSLAGGRLRANILAELSVIGLVAIATGVLTTIMSPPAEQHAAGNQRSGSPKIFPAAGIAQANRSGIDAAPGEAHEVTRRCTLTYSRSTSRYFCNVVSSASVQSPAAGDCIDSMSAIERSMSPA